MKCAFYPVDWTWKLIDHINSWQESSDLVSSISVLDPRQLTDTEKELSSYVNLKITTILKFHGSTQKVQFEGEKCTSQPDSEIEEAVTEWNFS